MMAATKFNFQLDQSGPFQPGDEVSGRLVLHVSVDRDHVRDLDVCFVARETATIRHREVVHPMGGNDTNRNRVKTIREQSHHDVALISLPIPNKHNNIIVGGDVIPVGQYEIPFQFTIPTHIPVAGNGEIDKERSDPTTMILEADRSRASIFCGILATIHRDAIKSKDIVGQHAMNIYSPPIPKQVGMSEPQVYKMTGLIFRGGDIIMGCKLTNIMLRRGETPRLHLCLINESMAKVQTMLVQLLQVSKWTAQTKSKKDTTILWSHAVQVNIHKKKGLVKKGATDKALLEQHKQYIARELKESQTESQYSTAYTLPLIPISTTKAINTYQGVKIQVTHQLVVQLVASGFYDNITVPISIRIVDKDRKKRPPLQATPISTHIGAGPRHTSQHPTVTAPIPIAQGVKEMRSTNEVEC